MLATYLAGTFSSACQQSFHRCQVWQQLN